METQTSNNELLLEYFRTISNLLLIQSQTPLSRDTHRLIERSLEATKECLQKREIGTACSHLQKAIDHVDFR
jgi:hypothetical protein